MSASGKWSVVVKAPMGDMPVTFDLVDDGATLSGTVTRSGDQTKITNGRVQDDKLSWRCTVTQPKAGDIDFTATVSGNSISGDLTGPLGTGTFAGKKA